MTTEAKAEGRKRWIVEHSSKRKQCKPPKSDGDRKDLKQVRKALAGRYCQLLMEHGATGDFLCNRIRKLASDKCWRGGTICQSNAKHGARR